MSEVRFGQRGTDGNGRLLQKAGDSANTQVRSPRRPKTFELCHVGLPLVSAEVVQHPGVHHHWMARLSSSPDGIFESCGRVTAPNLSWHRYRDFDRCIEAMKPFRLLGPHARTQPVPVLGVG